MFKEELEKIRKEAQERLESSESLDMVNEIRVGVLGKKGSLKEILKGMKNVPPEERPKVGQMVNEVREQIEAAISDAQKTIERKVQEQRLASETIDVTLPSKRLPMGHSHPNVIALKELERIFVGMGYEVIEGPEVERDYYNFEALNIPADHPAKDEQDTFYINGDILLRTQTSSTQIHAMESGKIPIRMIAPGRVYRSDAVDATHSPTFHQVEGLVVDKGVTFADLKGTLDEFAKKLFGEETKTRFRPHHFPFTEPSAEMDVSDGCQLLQVRRQGLQLLQGRGLDRDPRLRYGTSPCP